MKSISAKCGHVKRKLNQNEPLEGELLEFALSLIGDSDHELLIGIAEKLKRGDKLDDYEHHTMVDVILLHARLGA
ncbi:MAG: hypothetical protein ACRESJ_29170 [Pseudomonas sp.]|uniref:hypothetical protein n=1 Tax=Pseudomonas sp. TaxID=306 RepID=UPI003D6F7237